MKQEFGIKDYRRRWNEVIKALAEHRILVCLSIPEGGRSFAIFAAPRKIEKGWDNQTSADKTLVSSIFESSRMDNGGQCGLASNTILTIRIENKSYPLIQLTNRDGTIADGVREVLAAELPKELLSVRLSRKHPMPREPPLQQRKTKNLLS